MGRWHSEMSVFRLFICASILFLMAGCATMQGKCPASSATAPHAVMPCPAQTVETPVQTPEIPALPVAKAPEPLPPGVPCIWPVKDDSRIILSSYGYRGGHRGGPGAFHRAVDIKTPMNAPVVAAANGIVKKESRGGDYGNMVVLDHQNGFQSVYAHLNAFKVDEGQQVAKGDIIGLAGQTGNATCPHVHYEIRKNEEAVNPAKFLPMEETRIEKLATLVPATAPLADAKPERIQVAKVDENQYGVPTEHQAKTKIKKSYKKQTRSVSSSKSALTPSKAIVGSSANKKKTGFSQKTSDIKNQENKTLGTLSTKANNDAKKITKSKKSDVNKAATAKVGSSSSKATTKKTVKKTSTASK